MAVFGNCVFKNVLKVRPVNLDKVWGRRALIRCDKCLCKKTEIWTETHRGEGPVKIDAGRHQRSGGQDKGT